MAQQNAKKSKRVTMTEIARSAGVSQGAVSLVLSGKAGAHRIPPETAKRIREAAQRMGYAARKRRKATEDAADLSNSVHGTTGRSVAPRTIGVIFIEYKGLSGDILYSPAYLGLCRAATGHEVRQYGGMGSAGLADWVRSGELAGHDGLVVFSHRDVQAADLQPIEDLKIPWIMMNRDPENLRAPRVLFDAYNMAYGLLELLLRSGHRRIAILGSHAMTASQVGQRAGCRDALSAAGCYDEDLALMDAADWDETGFREGVAGLLKRRPDVTALYAFFDRFTEGIYAGVRDAGRRIPDDFSVAACGGQPVTQRVTPPLTTIRYPMLEMGEAAFRLLDRIWRGQQVPLRTVIPGELLPGGSIGHTRTDQ